MSALWPLTVSARSPDGLVLLLRPLRRRDRRQWEALREANQEWLRPWEATAPEPVGVVMSHRALVRYYDREAAAGRLEPFVIEAGGRLVGQMHLFGISWGSMRSASAGYWVSQETAGMGVAPLALAALGDHAFGRLGLHRVEVNIRPENAASLRVVSKLGFRDEGVRLRYLHIDGAWRDHRTFALTAEELGGQTLVQRLSHAHHQSQQRHTEWDPR